jgi:hypothetical protein
VRLIFGKIWDVPWQFLSEKSPRDLLKHRQAPEHEQPSLPDVPMHGEISKYDAARKTGELLGPNGLNYFFLSPKVWRVGDKVTFTWCHLPQAGLSRRAAMNLKKC